MANKPEIRYINYYTSGTAARKVEPQPERRKKTRLPKPRPAVGRELVLRVDPVAIAGIMVAAVLIILMAVGVTHLYEQQEQVRIAEQYLEQLKVENQQLQEYYANGYDLEEIREYAVAMGMVPKDTLSQSSIHVVLPKSQAQPSAWEEFWSFVKGMFA